MDNELPPLTIDAVYDTIQGLKIACKKHAVARFFEFNTVKSDKRRYTIKCKANNCHWRLHATSIENSKRFRVRILSENHDCFAMNHVSHANASEDYIASIIKDKLEQECTYSVKQIRRDILGRLRITISRSKAYRARELAFKMIDGTHEDAYAKLSQYCEDIVTSNPGSIAFVESTSSNQFRRVFMCFNASAEGLPYCVPIIGLDGICLCRFLTGIRDSFNV